MLQKKRIKMRRLILLNMSTSYYFLLYFFLPIFAHSCPAYKFSCGIFNLDIEFPFFSNNTSFHCQGLHHIQCINQLPVIQFHGQGFLFPVWNIMYRDKTIIVHDLKLSSYFRGSDCVFLYDLISPVPRFNVSNLSEVLSSGQSFFNCKQNGYNFSSDIFQEFYNFTPCKYYNLYYTYDMADPSIGDYPGYCLTSSGSWFDWKLSFGEEDGDGGVLSLLSAGFSREWTAFPDCFNCRIMGNNCSSNSSGVAGDPTCECNNQCLEMKQSSYGAKNRRIIIGKFEVRWQIIIGIYVGFASFLIGSFFFVLRYHSQKNICEAIYWKKKATNTKNIEAFLEKYGSLAAKRYTYSDVKKMTKSFSEKLGQGGYGSVFKGKLFDGNLVAVKVLSESKGNGEDFINEVATIGNTSHVNVVTLRGFCVEGSKRALIYEFMPNGSLEKYIYSEKIIKKASLGWEKLYEIAIGIAHGLEYLHPRCNTRIVHFDIKPHNILLDHDFCPKISDFGMAKLCARKESIISMYGARGTIGYIALEVFSRTFGVVSSKSDVYSYGMMVLEMFGGKRNRYTGLESSSDTYFPQWIYEHLDKNDNLMAYGVMGETEEIARKMMIVGFWCIQTMPDKRPSMSRVVDMLEGSINDLPILPKPCLSSPLDLIVCSCTTSSS